LDLLNPSNRTTANAESKSQAKDGRLSWQLRSYDLNNRRNLRFQKGAEVFLYNTVLPINFGSISVMSPIPLSKWCNKNTLLIKSLADIADSND
jgi:hypothetical protein